MRKSVTKTIRTQILNLESGDTLVFTIGDIKANLIPTQKELEDFRKMVLKEVDIPKDVQVAIFPPYVKTSIIRKKCKRSKRLTTYDRLEKSIQSLYKTKVFKKMLNDIADSNK